MNQDDFFDCFLAALRKETPQVRTQGLHVSFIRALKVVKRKNPDFGKGIDFAFDPLYEISDWLIKQINRASFVKKIHRDFDRRVIEFLIAETEADEILRLMDSETKQRVKDFVYEFLRELASRK